MTVINYESLESGNTGTYILNKLDENGEKKINFFQKLEFQRELEKLWLHNFFFNINIKINFI